MKQKVWIIFFLAMMCLPVLAFAEVVSGAVTLPAGTDKGNLYVVLYPSTQGILELDYYVMIPADAITLQAVPFEISGVTPGTYIIEAIWDIAEPFAEVKETSGSHIRLMPDEKKWKAASIFPMNGDYRVSDREKIEVLQGGSLKDVALECTTRMGG